jgi:hypothetical protein
MAVLYLPLICWNGRQERTMTEKYHIAMAAPAKDIAKKRNDKAINHLSSSFIVGGKISLKKVAISTIDPAFSVVKCLTLSKPDLILS